MYTYIRYINFSSNIQLLLHSFLHCLVFDINITTQYRSILYSGGSTSGSTPLQDHWCVFFFHLKKITIPIWEKWYKHKEWVILSITRTKFWKIATARTIKSSVFKNEIFPPILTSYFRFLQQAPRPIKRQKRKNNSCYMVYIRSVTGQEKFITIPAQINLQ